MVNDTTGCDNDVAGLNNDTTECDNDVAGCRWFGFAIQTIEIGIINPELFGQDYKS